MSMMKMAQSHSRDRVSQINTAESRRVSGELDEGQIDYTKSNLEEKEDWDGFDSDDTEMETEKDLINCKKKTEKFDSTGKQVYLGACKMYNQVPATYFLKESEKSTLRMRHYSLGILGTKAICVSLVSNTTLEVLDLDDNGMESQGCVYIADMLKENYFITDLTLSNNSIDHIGAAALFTVLKHSNSIIKLNLSGNKIGDRGAKDISEALMDNNSITDLNLSCNGFQEAAGMEFGKMLAANNTLERLDMSFNCLRMRGMQQFLQGVKKNTGLQYLKLSQNGIGMECCAELGKMLKENKTLQELDITNNRIPLAGVLPLARAFKFNTTLKSLDLSRNVFMASGCLVMVEALLANQNWALRFLSFGTIVVNRQFTRMQETLEKEHYLLIMHGGVMEEWNTGPIKTPASTRQALCFLNDQECHKIGVALKSHDDLDKGGVSLKIVSDVLNELGWSNCSREIVRRLTPLIVKRLVEYKSLL